MVMLPAAGWSFDSKHQLSGTLLQAHTFKPVAISNLPPEADDLGYRDNQFPDSYVSDLNGDGLPDYLIAAHPVLCGTGGCPYLLVDGKNRKAIGEFFGTIAILNLKINGYPVIQAVSKQDLATYVFDGKVYRLVALSLLEEQGMAAWKESLRQEKHP